MQVLPTIWQTAENYIYVTFSYWWLLLLGVTMPFVDGIKWHLPERVKLRKFKPWQRVLISFIFLSLAQFLAYRNSQSNLYTVIDEKKQLTTDSNALQAKLDEITKPDFHIFLDQGGASFSKGCTGIFILGRITNTGAPSSTTNWAVHYISPDFSTDVRPILFSDNFQSMIHMAEAMQIKHRFVKNDFLPDKSVNPIPHNGVSEGWIPLIIPGNRIKDFSSQQVTLVVSVQDATGRSYSQRWAPSKGLASSFDLPRD